MNRFFAVESKRTPTRAPTNGWHWLADCNPARPMPLSYVCSIYKTLK